MQETGQTFRFRLILKPGLSLMLLMVVSIAKSQNNRIHDHNTVSWFTTSNTIITGKMTSLYLEYNWRRINGISEPMQHLFRTGFMYSPSEKTVFMLGLAYAISYPYSEYPASTPEARFPERRIFQQVSIKDQIRKMTVTHRFRLEQRWTGRMDSGDIKKVASWNYSNRVRYQIKLSKEIIPSKAGKGGLYGVIQNELFISFGKNVKTNIFDQNRLGILLGTRLHRYFSIEGGYFNQVLQQGNLVANKAVIQNNRGLLMTLVFNR